MKYQNSSNDPYSKHCVNCRSNNCNFCEYFSHLSTDYGLSREDAKNVRDFVFIRGDISEEDAVNLIAKKGQKGVLNR